MPNKVYEDNDHGPSISLSPHSTLQTTHSFSLSYGMAFFLFILNIQFFFKLEAAP